MKYLLNIKRRLFLISIIFVGFILLEACEGYTCAKGVIYNNETKEPLDSVLCKVMTGSEEQYTDSIGHYAVCNDFGGCMPKCPDIKVEFSKTGFISKTIINPTDENIYLEKE